jgi:hypothetical protein
VAWRYDSATAEHADQAREGAHMTDLHFQEQGSVWLVQPITPKGEAWITDHTSVRALRWFGAIEIDRYFAQDMFNGASADGLDVRIDTA